MKTNPLLKAIPLRKQIDEFKQYLDLSSWTLLSANQENSLLAEVQKNSRLLFHLSNYSVSSKDDIFEYIKWGISLQLDKDGKLGNIDVRRICESSLLWEIY